MEYDEGYDAYYRGINVNPYPIGCPEGYDWDQGWEDAEYEDD